MDLVFKEYSSPFSFIDSLIISERFCEWIDTFLEKHKEKVQWEYWLHKVFDMTWNEYKKNCDEKEKSSLENEMTEDEVETAVNDSMNILNNFIPEKL
ncbi:hypothetical protein P261_02279 [Lachnospiraceae bacterium TWA4]|nr:hypothetical protein P261_02279 [Lachnospiraceae bacterium TWA4]